MNKRNYNNRKAFTMIEIIAVLVIVGLLSGVAVKSFMSRIEKAKVITKVTKGVGGRPSN